MDPSYNNSFDRVSTGSGFPEGGVITGGYGVGSSGTGSFNVSSVGAPQGDIVIASPVSPKKRFGKIIAIIVGLVILVGGAIVAVTIIKNQGSPKEEIYSALRDFYVTASYKDMTEILKGMDLKRKDQPAGFIYIVNEDFVNSISQELEFSQTAYEKLKRLNPGRLPNEQREKFNLMIKNVDNTLNTIQKNTDAIADFYNGFVGPLTVLRDEEKLTSCKKTNDVQALIESYSDNDMAEKYFSVFCKMIEADVLPEEFLALAQDFIDAFDDVVIDIDNYHNDEIQTLIDYLEAPDEES
ncbi:hypothetical protein IJJ36_04530 [Candidatus Saccharibacteria bacterium]|nr:hypothetical protein [Candidatus Saccharibacteria bacterium]